MLSSVTQIIGTAFSNCMSWFNSILNGTGTLALVVGAIFVVLVIRFILRPVFGGAVADNARSLRKGSNKKGGK